MKKVLISLIMLVPLLTGCANIDTMLTINDDKSASVTTSLAYRGNLSAENDFTALAISDLYKNFIDTTYKVETANSANLSTITATKKVNDLSKMDLDLSSLGLVSNLASKKFVEVRKSFLLSSFNVDCTFDATKYSKELNDTINNLKENSANSNQVEKAVVEASNFNKELIENLDEDTKNAMLEVLKEDEAKSTTSTTPAEFSNSFSIQVPSIASYNNADSISGNVYTWNIKKDEPTQIKLQYVQYSGFAIAFIILAGILLLVIIASRILKRDSQKRIDNIDNIV